MCAMNDMGGEPEKEVRNMFSLKRLQDTVFFRRQEILQDIISSGKSLEIFYSPGHVFVLKEDGKCLQTFDIVTPSTNQIFHVEEGNLIVETSGDRIIKLLFTNDHNSIYIVYTHGRMEHWKFYTHTSTWQHIATEDILDSQSNHSIEDPEGVGYQSDWLIDVVLHPLHNSVYWCQVTEKEGKEEYCVYGRPFHSEVQEEGDEGDDQKMELGSRSHLISFCPPCTLHISGDSLLIKFRPPCPPGLYMKWNQTSRDLVSFIHPTGRICSDKVYLQPVNFKQLAVKTASVWSKAPPITDWIVVRDFSNENTLFIDCRGVVWTSNRSQEFQEVCHLQDWDIDDVTTTRAVLCQYGILVSNNDCSRLYDVESGAMVQELTESTSIIRGVWTSTCGSYTGLYTVQNMYWLQLQPSLTWPSSEYATRLLRKTGQNLHATLVHLEDIKNENVQTPPKNNALPLSDILQNLQSPALLLSLLHMNRSCRNQASLSDAILKTEDGHLPDTSLALDLAPLVRKFTELEKLNWKQFTEPQLMSKSSVEDEVRRAFQLEHSDEDQAAYQQFTYLATRWPKAVAIATVTQLGLDKPDYEPDCTAFWEALRSGGGESFHGNVLRVAIAHHLFLHSPKHLIPFLDLLCGAGKEEHAAFRGIGQEPVIKQILEHLPDPSLSVDIPAAAQALASITARSGGENCQHYSLSVLLRHKLWKEAVTQLSRQDRRHGEYSHLFQTVFTALLKAGVFTEYCEELLAISPENMSGVSLLHQLKKSSKQPSSVFCEADSKEDVRFGRVREQLTRFFTQ